MELSKEQIDQLFKFTEKKYVRWYDLQLEVVDHLATKIEEAMSQDSKLSFEDALRKVYKGFGIFGFAKIVQQKEYSVQKQRSKIWWRTIKEFFTWPKLTFTVCLFLVAWQLSHILAAEYLRIIFLVTYILTAVWLAVSKKRNRIANKKLLILEYNPENNWQFFYLYQTIIFTLDDNWSPLMFSVLTVAGTIMHIATVKLYRSVMKNAEELYPEAFTA